MGDLIPQEKIESRIFVIRGMKVMLDKDLAELYGVQTKQLTRQVRRNIERFPEDFAFQLSNEEFKHLKCQFGASSWGGTRKLPLAFTENGIAMLSGVLHSYRAIQVNIQIMRAFTRLRQMLLDYKEIWKQIEMMEQKYDNKFKIVFDTLKHILQYPNTGLKDKIGFKQ